MTIPALFTARASASGDAPALREFDAASRGLSDPLSWREWHERSLDVAAAIVEAGVERGASFAILARNTLLWPLAELGAVQAGLVTVGIYPTAAAAQVRALLADTEAVAVVVDTALQLATVREATADGDHPLLVIADVPLSELRADGASPVREVQWSAFVAGGQDARRREPRIAQLLHERRDVVMPDDIAMMIYTSGSTGVPKGARISHRYVVESARSIQDTLGLGNGDSSLSFLPFSHAGERIFGLYTRIACGMLATLVEDPGMLWEASVAAEPTLFGGMPRFFEKAYEGLLAARADLSGGAAQQWDRAIASGRERARLRQHGREVPASLESSWRSDRVVIEPVLVRQFGARLRLATSGGAALPLEVAEYLDACGVTVLGAYGQTEHLCAAFNRPGQYRHDSVGLAMPGTTMRIAPDGEIQLRRSALTFSGYHRCPDESREAFTADGSWLRTGDLGTLDADGFLRITGRAKELIALSNGKKVAPLPLEARLAEGTLIAHAMIHGEGHPYLVAVVALRWPLVAKWQRDHGIEGDAKALVRHPALRAAVEQEVARLNADVSRPEQVRRFAILPGEFTIEAGEITPTHKVRRSVVAARYAAELEALYLEST